MSEKQAVSAVVLFLLIVGPAGAGYTFVDSTQVWNTGFTLGAGDVLEIGPNGNLTVNDLGTMGGGAELIINGGTFTYNHYRFNINDAAITVNSGTAFFDCQDEVKFGDDYGPSYLYLDGGVFHCTSFELDYARQPHIIVAGGVFRIEDDDVNPQAWIDHGGVVEMPPGFAELVVERVTAQTPNYYELRAVEGLAPNPANRAMNVPVDTLLGWSIGRNAVTYDVYMGTDAAEVAAADNSLGAGTGVYKANTGGNSYDPGNDLETGQTYYWRIDEVNDANSASPWTGVVWDFTTVGKAYNPSPPDNSGLVAYNTLVEWTAGEGAVSHDVYFGSDHAAVAAATTASGLYKGNQALGANSFDPGDLQFGRTYYWRVDEVGDSKTIKGAVWSFTVRDFLLIDDFESYDGTPDLKATWNELDGAWVRLSSLRSGGTIYFHESHGGAQSMLVEYLSWSPYVYSEGRRTFAEPADFTVGNLALMELYFRGVSDNQPDRMYVRLEDASGSAAEAAYGGSLNDLTVPQWQLWRIPLSQFTGVDLANVEKVSVGIGNRSGGSTNKSGRVFFDDIGLYPPVCLPEYAPGADLSGDCLVNLDDMAVMGPYWMDTDYITGVLPDANDLFLWYKFDETSGGNPQDSSGNGYHAIAHIGDANFVTDAFWEPSGRSGGAIKFDGELKSYGLEIPPEAFSGLSNQLTISVWVNWSNPATMPEEFRSNLFSSHGGPGDVFLQFLSVDAAWANGMLRFKDSAREAFYAPRQQDWSGGWNHYAFVKDASAGVLGIYLNGLLVAGVQSSEPLNLPVDLVRIGVSTEQWNDPYTGLLDDFRVYGHALSQAEIIGLAAGQGSQITIPQRADANLRGADHQINYGDLAVIADQWLVEQLWP